MTDPILIALLSPILLTIGGLITWFVKSKKEERLLAEEKSRQFKIETYKNLLEPFIATLTFSLPEKQKLREINKITSLEYRKTVFDLTTFGSDEVMKAFNQIMQTFFHAEELQKSSIENEYTIRLMALLSELLLQIRKDIYSKKTDLQRSDTVEFMLTDIENYKDQINSYKI